MKAATDTGSAPTTPKTPNKRKNGGAGEDDGAASPSTSKKARKGAAKSDKVAEEVVNGIIKQVSRIPKHVSAPAQIEWSSNFRS